MLFLIQNLNANPHYKNVKYLAYNALLILPKSTKSMLAKSMLKNLTIRIKMDKK